MAKSLIDTTVYQLTHITYVIARKRNLTVTEDDVTVTDDKGTVVFTCPTAQLVLNYNHFFGYLILTDGTDKHIRITFSDTKLATITNVGLVLGALIIGALGVPYISTILLILAVFNPGATFLKKGEEKSEGRTKLLELADGNKAGIKFDPNYSDPDEVKANFTLGKVAAPLLGLVFGAMAMAAIFAAFGTKGSPALNLSMWVLCSAVFTYIAWVLMKSYSIRYYHLNRDGSRKKRGEE